MRIINWIKRKLDRCDLCWKRAVYHLNPEHGWEKQYCYDHIIGSGFCAGCGGFFGGVESFDCSEIEGYCSDCVDEINWDSGEGEEMGDMDYYDDYGHDFSEKQPQETEGLPEKYCIAPKTINLTIKEEK